MWNLAGHTSVGARTVIAPFASLGGHQGAPLCSSGEMTRMSAIDQGVLPHLVTAAQSCHSRRLPGDLGVTTAIRTDVRNWHKADMVAGAENVRS